jgi:hypothetical protein
MGLFGHPFDGGRASRAVFIDGLLVSIDGATIVLSLNFRSASSIISCQPDLLKFDYSKLPSSLVHRAN